MKTEMDGFLFEWDEEKNELNKKKHGIRFELATIIHVFTDMCLQNVPHLATRQTSQTA